MTKMMLMLVVGVVSRLAASERSGLTVLGSAEEFEKVVIDSTEVWTVLFQALPARPWEGRPKALAVADALAHELATRVAVIGVKDAAGIATEYAVRERSAPKLLVFHTRSRNADKVDLPKTAYTRSGEDVETTVYDGSVDWLTADAPGKFDGKQGKHVPSIDVDATGTTATIRTPHPDMTEAHHITQLRLFIILQDDDDGLHLVNSTDLGPSKDAAVAHVPLPQGRRPVTLIATSSCNTHGVWKSNSLQVDAGILPSAVAQVNDLVASYPLSDNGVHLKATLGLGGAGDL